MLLALTMPNHVSPSRERVLAFATDPAWAGKPFWMLNVLRFKPDGGAEKYARYGAMMVAPGGPLDKAGGRVVLGGHARALVGAEEFDQVAIVEYPSPTAFVAMASSAEYEQVAQVRGAARARARAARANILPRSPQERLAGLESQYLIPMRAGFYQLEQPAPAVRAGRSVRRFTPATAWATPSGLVGGAAAGARVGETTSTKAQVEGFMADRTLGGAATPLWHLNLLKFIAGDGAKRYKSYARPMGKPGGLLNQYGARSTLARACFPSLLGEHDFDSAIIAEYPDRDHFLSMASDPEYLATSAHRHAALEQTCIVSVAPLLPAKLVRQLPRRTRASL